MHEIVQPNAGLMETTRRSVHSRCVVCGRTGSGLGLQFRVLADGSVQTDFDCDAEHEGYPGMLHGGVICAIADGAMTNCLFAYGIVAVTADMNVRFRFPVQIGKPLTVNAKITRTAGPLFMVEAVLSQNGRISAKATAKFMQRFNPTV